MTYTKCVLVDLPVEVDEVGVPSTTVTTTLESVTTPTEATEADIVTPSEVMEDAVLDVLVLVGTEEVKGVEEKVEVDEVSSSSSSSSLEEDELEAVDLGFSASSPPFVTAVGGAKFDVVETVEVRGAR